MNHQDLEKLGGCIFICGFMASGKSTFGAALAKKLGISFKDLDKVIVKREQKTIKSIFNQKGEDYFRNCERNYLFELINEFKGVIALGGGALQNQEIVEHVKKHGVLIFIDTPLAEITERVYRNNKRPIKYYPNGEIKSKESLFAELKTLYLKREKLYKQAQIHITTTSFESNNEMVETAMKKLSSHV